MTDDKEVDYYKELEYGTVHVDGIIINPQTLESRLIFYQNKVNLNEDSTGFDTTKKNRSLLFEVRISNFTLEHFCQNVISIIKMITDSHNLADALRDDPEAMEAWRKLTDDMETIYSDSEKQFPDDDAQKKMKKSSEALAAKAMYSLQKLKSKLDKMGKEKDDSKHS